MRTNYFGEGLGAKLGEFKLKYEALAKDACISEKTVCRASDLVFEVSRNFRIK